MNTSTIIYIIIILIALTVIFLINKEFFMGLIGNVKKKDIPRPTISRPVVKAEPTVSAPAPAVAPTPTPAPVSQADDTWTCICGAVNTRKFCAECGEKRPEKKEIKCPACGYKPEAGEKIPKFCPECGVKMDC